MQCKPMIGTSVIAACTPPSGEIILLTILIATINFCTFYYLYVTSVQKFLLLPTIVLFNYHPLPLI